MTKIEATKAGKVLLKKLGKGWRLRVWENHGWHYSATRGPIAVHTHGAEYFALIDSDPKCAGGGLAAWSTCDDRTYRDPRLAVKKAIAPVIKYVAQLNEVVRICAQTFKDFNK
jgi:hypothetical protein